MFLSRGSESGAGPQRAKGGMGAGNANHPLQPEGTTAAHMPSDRELAVCPAFPGPRGQTVGSWPDARSRLWGSVAPTSCPALSHREGTLGHPNTRPLSTEAGKAAHPSAGRIDHFKLQYTFLPTVYYLVNSDMAAHFCVYFFNSWNFFFCQHSSAAEKTGILRRIPFLPKFRNSMDWFRLG